MAVHRTVQGNTDIWLLDADRTTRFTFDAALDRFPIWSPDGSRIVFDSNRRGSRDLYQKPSSGAGSEELLLESAQDKSRRIGRPTAGSSFISASIRKQAWDLWVLPLEGDRKPLVFLKTTSMNAGPVLAGWALGGVHSNESGRLRSMCGRFRDRAASGRSRRRAGSSRWGPDGKELYYIGPDGTLMAAPIAVTARRSNPADRWRCFARGSVVAARTQSGNEIRRRPRRPLPDQHGPGRRLLPHHAASELASENDAITPRRGFVLESCHGSTQSKTRGALAPVVSHPRKPPPDPQVSSAV